MRVIFPTDEHFPFQDDAARSVALQIGQDFNPDLRISGSDGVDFYRISKFDKNPDRFAMSTLQYEIDLWCEGQHEWLDATPNAMVRYIKGNHEDRLRKYIWSHPELSGLRALEIPNLLDFSALGIEKIEDEIELPGLLITHGDIVRKHSAYTAKAALENNFHAVSMMTGHTHRGGAHYITTRNGVVQSHECFCLCSLEPEYMQHPNWQQGIVLAEVTRTRLSIEPIPFFRHRGKVRAIWRGKEYIEK